MSGMADMSATPFLDLLLIEASRSPEKAAALAELLRPPDRLTEDDSPRLLSAGEAGQRLGVNPRTLQRAARAGRVPGATRCGRSWRFEANELALLPPTGSALSPSLPARSRSGTSSAATAIRGNPPQRKDSA